MDKIRMRSRLKNNSKSHRIPSYFCKQSAISFKGEKSNFIKALEYESLFENVVEIKRMLASFIKKLIADR
ncbi:MAG: hypothetical protein SWX82_23685 [Cyanobacteriota bacterium]|nr:hypothetical protein [Cyanobacteriota bacterium]